MTATRGAAVAHLTGNAIWVTWEHQRRNAGIADALGAPLFELDIKAGRFKRYALSLWRTLRVFRRTKPDLIFAQNPSLVLALATIGYGKVTGIKVVVDAHNAAVMPLLPGESGLLSWLCRLAVRGADFTIVSNERLAGIVQASGGRPVVLADRLPQLSPATPSGSPAAQPRVVFICTYAPDEPYMTVLEAAGRLDPRITVFVTGNPKHRAAALREAAPPNVRFTGFLAEEEYLALLRSADVVMDLTTREDCLVCGGYEAVALEQPLILSGTVATRSYFTRGVRYTDNSAADLADAVNEALAKGTRMREELRALKAELVSGWNAQFNALVSAVNSDARARNAG